MLRRILMLAMALALSPAAHAASPTADYRVRFEAFWSAQTHPLDFPPVPHFSGLIGATHNAGADFWEVGQAASTGIEEMAETGSKLSLTGEINAEMPANADQVISGGGIGLSPGAVELTFTASQSYPLLTLVSMVAPSPDWFVGVDAVPLFEAGDWRRQVVVDLFVYDAGTDSGTTYLAADDDTQPPDPIQLNTAGPFANGVKVGTFTITRTDAAALPALPWGGLLLLALALGVALRRRA